MGQSFKVALDGIDALTNTDPDNFALYVDADDGNDYILIKEKAIGATTVSDSSFTNIAHGLGYVPFCLVFAEVSSGVWRKIFSYAIDGSGLWFEVDDTNLVLRNSSGGDVDFSYHIFYDNIT